MINGHFGTQYTLGVQGGEDARYLKTVVTLKHWDAYSLENSDGFTRHNFNAIVSNYSLESTYLPAFRASVKDGDAKGVMCRCALSSCARIYTAPPNDAPRHAHPPSAATTP